MFATLLFVLYWATEVTQTFAPINTANAALASLLLDMAGASPVRSGATLSLAGGGMQIVSECSGVYVAILFAAAVLAFPTTWAARARGLALGLPLLFLVNVLRLFTLGLVLEHRASLLPLVHEYLWQVLFVLLVAALYVVWIERIVPRERAIT
jgi:archaeosortase B (VPXXXP-CTERM-specific)